jgi:hypothetical protein
MMEALMLARTHPWKRLSKALEEPGRWEPVFFLVSILAVFLFVGYFQVRLTEPAALTLDHVFSLSGAKSLIRGHGGRFEPQLGFPEPRDLLYFPSFEPIDRIAFWIGARLTDNPFALVQIVYALGLPVMACAYYWTLRRLEISAWLAVVGTLGAIVTPYLQERIYWQDALALSFSVPVGFGLALQIARQASTATLRSFFMNPMVFGAMLLVGTSGLYYAFYSVLIAVLVGVAYSAGERRLFPLLAALVVAEVVLVVLLVGGYGLDLPAVLKAKGGTPQPQRYAFEQLAYGLDLTAAADRFTFMPKVVTGISDVKRFGLYLSGDLGAWPALPLTLAVMATPLVMIAGQARLRTLEGPAASKLRLAVLCATLVVFMVWFGARGGLGYIFNLVAMPQIRADSRVLPVFTFGAVVMLCLLAETARDSDRRWIRYGGPLAVALVLLVSAASSFGAAAKVQSANLADRKTQALRASVQQMLVAKDKAGLQTVLQLPVITWPEAVPDKMGYMAYEQQLPFIFDRRDSATRWSYGANEKQPGFKRLQALTAKLDGLPERARGMGFDSILVDKRAYEPTVLAKVEAAVAPQAGSPCRLYEDQTYALYALACVAGASSR